MIKLSNFRRLIYRDQVTDNTILVVPAATTTQKSNNVRTAFKTDSEKRVDEKRLKDALKTVAIGAHDKNDLVSRLNPVLHKTTGRSRRNTSEKYF